ncbi:MAG: EAL domain-containing protein [Alphaproteobacteria bacterium]|jgi:EAL domain-containing protein (putative c-di-GMP-specific phosphodiesterase class I)|nr:EAL domain-containing protein [Alphaproteobacteria bacterium]MBT4086151.1 EAL domain-containing protein [Alphaproteobacteria bacterium]MBT4543768.1 EAL domain-containing protein [Alphaproteobacteria bacterium]MBT7744013.1 EAL domain-containing protein [Alphaproteobacteria bacterium]
MRDQIIFHKPAVAERRQGVSRQSLATGLHTVLQNGLRRNELSVHYQPRIATKTAQISGCEALVRWHHPHLGLIEPERFIPVAEETGMITELGEWVLFTALATQRQWKEADLEPGIMAVNVSPRQLVDPAFGDMVERLLDTTGVSPAEIELEITESTRLDNLDQVIRTMARLDKLGIKFAMDDFGAGYASLDYIRKLPVSSIKIDQSFIRNIATNNRDALLVKSMVNMANDLGLKVVAEGIQDQNQLEILRPMACDEFQGFLFSPPLTIDSATSLISKAPGFAI